MNLNSNNYWVIDPVLDRFNKEAKPIIEIYDKAMGIPLQELSGLDKSYLGCPDKPDANNCTSAKKTTCNTGEVTKAALAKDSGSSTITKSTLLAAKNELTTSHSFSQEVNYFFNRENLLSSIEYLIKNFDNPVQFKKAVSIVRAQKEKLVNAPGINGLGSLSDQVKATAVSSVLSDLFNAPSLGEATAEDYNKVANTANQVASASGNSDLKNVAGGAASGAATGAVAGPWGAAIGGIVGGIYGYVSGKPKEDIKKDELIVRSSPDGNFIFRKFWDGWNMRSDLSNSYVKGHIMNDREAALKRAGAAHWDWNNWQWNMTNLYNLVGGGWEGFKAQVKASYSPGDWEAKAYADMDLNLGFMGLIKKMGGVVTTPGAPPPTTNPASTPNAGVTSGGFDWIGNNVFNGKNVPGFHSPVAHGLNAGDMVNIISSNPAYNSDKIGAIKVLKGSADDGQYQGTMFLLDVPFAGVGSGSFSLAVAGPVTKATNPAAGQSGITLNKVLTYGTGALVVTGLVLKGAALKKLIFS